MAGYSSRIEAEDMINLQWAKFNKLLAMLQGQDKVSWMAGA
jgi:hypothetical protein